VPCKWSPFVLVGALVLASCAPPAVQLRRGPREYVADDYDVVLRRWTRSQGLVALNAIDTSLLATATFESWDFRWAYITRYADDYRLTVDQRHELLQQALAQTEEYHQFYLALHASRMHWADLDGDNPAWIVRLIDDQGNETAPAEIKRIRKPAPTELAYFPYTTPWRTCYRLRFAVRTLDGRPTIAESARWLGLRFAGAQGSQRLVWEIEVGGAPTAESAVDSPAAARERAPNAG
jgi:hypothetical protein